MPAFLNGSELSLRLNNALRDASTARFAVAFWGRDAADALGIREGNRTKFQIVCNLLSGGTNPNEIRKLIDRGADVRQLNNLHAKLGLIDDFSFLGSSNMSANGLGAEGLEVGWREANIVYENARPEISDLFESFWTDATEITEGDLQAAAEAWEVRQRGNAMIAARIGNLGLVEVLRANPTLLDALNVRMVVYDTVIDAEERAVLDEADGVARRRYGEAFTTYWNWDSMMTEAASAYLISFDWPPRGVIARGTLYRRDTNNFADFTHDGEIFHPAYEVDTIEEITFGVADRQAIRAAFHRYVQAGHPGEEEDQRAYNFPLSELSEYLPPVG